MTEGIKKLLIDGRDIDADDFAYHNTKHMQKTFYLLCRLLVFSTNGIVNGSGTRIHDRL